MFREFSDSIHRDKLTFDAFMRLCRAIRVFPEFISLSKMENAFLSALKSKNLVENARGAGGPLTATFEEFVDILSAIAVISFEPQSGVSRERCLMLLLIRMDDHLKSLEMETTIPEEDPNATTRAFRKCIIE